MLRRLALVALAGLAAVPVAVAPTRPAAAAPPAAVDDVVAVVLDGQGNGHGRGLSQWGAYGRAIADPGQSADQILDAYYGGTARTQVEAGRRITVRLLALDGQQTTVVAGDGTAARILGEGGDYGALSAAAVQGGYQVYGNANRTCGTADPGWEPVGGVRSDVNFTSPAGDDVNFGTTLGVCQPDGQVRYYRGLIRPAGGWTVDDVPIELYLRGVLPREVPASWGDAAGGKGMNALMAQAVAARSYGLAQNRYGTTAKTCDSSSCQVYGGAQLRSSAVFGDPNVPLQQLEDPRTNQAIINTDRVVILKNGSIASAEFSASNGGTTAGNTYPAIDDPYDDQPGNPLYRWTRVLSPAQAMAAAGVSGTLTDATVTAANPSFNGPWANAPRLTVNGATVNVDANGFRAALGLPSVAFTIRVVRRDFLSSDRLAVIGDSVGESVMAGSGELPTLLDGVFANPIFDGRTNRCTVGASCGGGDGIGAVNGISGNVNLAIVELGYNDSPSSLGPEIDQMMNALVAKGVRTVAWVNMSERRQSNGQSTYAASNAALSAARSRWPQLVVLDWNAASSGPDRDRWYADGVHLSSTGQAELSLWLRNQAMTLTNAVPGSWTIKVSPSAPLHLKVGGVGPVPAGVAAVSLNVTAVTADDAGYLTVWPCSAPRPTASNVNYIPGQTVANAVIAPVDANGEVCFYSYATSHLLVDINGWFTSGFASTVPNRLVDTRNGIGAPKAKIQPAAPLRLEVGGVGPVPAGVSAVSLNVTVTEPGGDGYLTVFPCASGVGPGSSVNFRRDQAVPNAVIAPVDADGDICLYSSVPTNAIVDLDGWFTSGFSALPPDRLVDTRNAIGAPKGKVQPAAPLRLKVGGVGPVPAGVSAVSLNVTVTEPAAQGYITVWPCASPMPVASNVNYAAGQPAVANAVIAPVDANGEVCFYTYAAANLIVDLDGWFTSGLSTTVPDRLVDTRNGIGPIPGR